ncbi:hypothetical protein [uncultured Roseobacter sp.]|uniref:hypothetical protein n=1 Tax=uncultured Roseobacter sp. TaxID=114847 RepID=UPI0026222880|nr:hypothetical protein [uncultured Roseobacter sp.]
MHKKSRISIQLFGPFSLIDENGKDITPVSQKAQALLALIAFESTKKRTRIWLQDKLWSTQDRAAGSTNLRQCLATIRKSLGVSRGVLGANRVSVWLDPDYVSTDSEAGDRQNDAEFLEGIDVPDNEFNRWLQNVRLSVETGSEGHIRSSRLRSDRRHWKIVLFGERNSRSLVLHLESQVLSILTRNLQEYGEIDVLRDLPDEPDNRTLEISLRAVPVSQTNISVRATVARSSSGHILWADTICGAIDPTNTVANFDLLGLAYRAQAAVMKEIKFSFGNDENLGEEGFLLEPVIDRVFSFRPQIVASARPLLDQGFSAKSAGTIMGWKAQLAIIELIERFQPDEEGLIEQGINYAARAVELDPMNSMVLSTAANANILLSWNTDVGAELSKLALKVNPTNPLAWISSALAAVYANRPEDGLKAAQVAVRLSRKTGLQFWCEFHVGLASLMLGNLEEARRAFEVTAALAPDFRPPLRYLLALYASKGAYIRAASVLQRLQRLEPELTIDEFVFDDRYPVSLGRSAGLICRESFDPLI